jgi:hypothetical protein
VTPLPVAEFENVVVFGLREFWVELFELTLLGPTLEDIRLLAPFEMAPDIVPPEAPRDVTPLVLVPPDTELFDVPCRLNIPLEFRAEGF